MPHTALYMGTSHFLGGSYPITTTTEADGDDRATQKRVDATFFRRKLELVAELGRGGTGVAFLARIKGKAAWVVKLPLASVTRELQLPASLGDVLLVAEKPSERVLAAFQNECRNAEQALDAPAVRHLRRKKLIEAHPEQTPEEIRRTMEVGARLCDLTEEEFREAKAARREWTRLPGYEYLHPVLHFDREIPLLLSLRCFVASIHRTHWPS
jgi:hypothetical protein